VQPSVSTELATEVKSQSPAKHGGAHDETGTGVEASQAAFRDWGKPGSNFTLYDRVLTSIIAVSYSQSEDAKPLNSYISSLSNEAKEAFSDRAAKILSEYSIALRIELQQESVEAKWVDAAKFGLKAHLDDFTDAQNQSFRSLNDYVRDKTSLKSQAWVAFGVALALGVTVSLVRPVRTFVDDISSAWTSSKEEQK
jgi:hypothetical protein